MTVCPELSPTVVGPFEQTMFLGCSVISVSSSVGWNEQESSITVEIAKDNCEGSKRYYPRPGQSSLWTDPDPGFQTPAIGGPVYFRLGDFEFAGVVQSWSESKSSSGNPIYSVVISDPRFLLQNLTVITSDYAGAVGATYNLINAYGNLEGATSDCPQGLINGASFGSPAGGFGTASVNTAGIPWNRLKESISSLLTGYANAHFSPYGHAVFKGHAPDASDPNRYSFGLLENDGFSQPIIDDFGGNGYTAKYFVDITEIPFTSSYFRIAGPSLSLMDIITQVADLAGCDYFIELIVTSLKQKVIKVRAVQRATQPTLGRIEQYVDTTDGVTAKDVGRELRNEPTSVFLYGAKVQTMYQQENDPSYIARYWGDDYFGNRILASGTFGSGYKIRMDFRGVQGGLVYPLKFNGANVNFLDVSEDELRFALGGVKPYLSYSLSLGAPTGAGGYVDFNSTSGGTDLGKALRESYDAVGSVTIPRNTEVARTNPNKPAIGIKIADNIGETTGNMLKGLGAAQSGKDAEKVMNFVKNFADEYYGKQYLVQLPLVCSGFDTDSQTNQYSDVPTSDGAYPASGTTNILGLPYPSTGMDVFTDESNKISCFVKYIKPTGSGSSLELTGGEYVEFSGNSLSGVFLKAEVESDKIYLYNGFPTALVKISNPPTTGSGSAIEDLLNACPIPQRPAKKIVVSGDPMGAMQRHMYKAAAYRFIPSGFAVPMLSNVVRYGPWNVAGPPGPVKFESDDALNPWEYGGYDTMQAAGIEKTREGVTFMQEGERGSLTLPGYPAKSLGSELQSTTVLMSGLSLANTPGTYTPYSGITMGVMNGTYGPNLTSMSVNIGEGGATTTYQFATFTPSFGRMSKLNSDRIKKLSKQRTKFFKEQRRMQLLNSKLRKAEKAIKNAEAIAKQVEKANAAKPPNNIKVGVIDRATSGNQSGFDVSDARSTDTVTQALSTDTGYYKKVAYVSDDAFHRPVSKSGAGELPRYIQIGDPPCTSGFSKTPSPPVTGWKRPAVNRDYLDPFAGTGTPKYHAGESDDNHHDVSIVSFGDMPRTGILNTMLLSEYGEVTKASSGRKDFPDDMRVMATKGPILLQSWGYDLQGKPVPNSADDEESAGQGTFTNDGLKDEFLDHWLRKPQTWPVAPIDLRLDKERGVWTIPTNFNIWMAEATGGKISTDSSGLCALIETDVPIFNSGGSSADLSIYVNNPVFGTDIAAGQKFFTFYDVNDCKYYPLIGGGSSITMFNSGTCEASLASDCFDEGECVSGTLSTIIAGTGLKWQVATVPTGYPLCSGAAHELYVRTPVKTSHRPPSYSKLADEECFTRWEAIHFDKVGFDLHYGESGGCEVLFVSGEMPKHRDLAVCDDDAPTFVGCVDIPGQCSVYGTGLTLGDDQSVNVQRTISSAACGTTHLDKIFYKHLTVGTGLKVEHIANCDYYLRGHYTISGTNPDSCGGNFAPRDDWETLVFGTGLEVRKSNCGIFVDLDVTLRDEDDCNTPLVATDKHFRRLVFGTGLQVTQGSASCEYKIDSDFRMADIEVCGKTSVTDGVVSVATLQCSTGIRLRPDSDCDYFLESDLKLKDSVPVCDGGATVTEYEHFSKLNFADNIHVTRNSKGCEYTIKGQNQLISQTSACGASAVAGGSFTTLSLRSGMHLKQDGSDLCKWYVDSVLKFKTSDGSQVGSDRVISVKAGCGLKVVTDGTCGVEIQLSPAAADDPGSPQRVTFAYDICCDSSGFTVATKDMVFTSCGLFSGVENEVACP